MKKSAKNSTTVSIEKEVNLKKYVYFLGFLVFILFANTIGNGYNMDDELVTMNHKLTSRGLEAIADIFTSPYYSDEMGYAYGYRPMVHLSFAIEHQLFGEKAGISHLINVLLFTFSVILFFKLVRNWVGEKNTWMALVIAVLFAVHPVHTEAVASLKNRDEILAFLFVILAGRSLGKYVETQHWKSLIFVSLYFLMAMLSKKSVYPMVLVLPLVYVLLQDLSWKHLLVGSIVLVLPGAIVASELNVLKSFLFTLFPLGGIFTGFLLKQALNRTDVEWKTIFLNVYVWATISLMLVFYSMLTFNLLIVPIAIFAACFVFWLDQKFGLIVFSIALLLIGTWYDYFELKSMVLLVLFFYILDNLLKKEKIAPWLMILAAVSVLFVLINDFRPRQLASIVALALFVFLVLKKQLFAWIFALLVLAISFYIEFRIPYFAILLLTFLIAQAVFQKANQRILTPFFAVLFTVIILFSPRFISDFHSTYTLRFPTVQHVQLVTKTETNVQANPSVIKEGRMLEFAENTLVKPHTTQETIGTGFATLGEYLRLTIFPVELSFYYGFSKINTVGLNDVWVWISIIVHVSLIVLAVWQIKKRPLITLGITWYLASILLFSNWVELVAGMIGERLAFTASAGFCIFLGGIIFWIKPSFSIQKPTWIEWTVLGVVVLFAFKTVQRNGQWKDALTLMSHDIQHLGNSAQANNLLALRLMQTSIENPDLTPEQRLEMQNRAIVHFDRAISIWPDFMNANFDKGRAAQVIGNHVKAIEGFQEAIRIDSTFHQAYFNLLTSYDQLGQTKQYLQTAKNLFKQNQDPAVFEYLARGYFLNQQKDSSSWILQEGIKKYPTVESLKANLQELRNLR